MTPQQTQLIYRLVEQHSSFMAQLAYRKLGDPQQAEDLVQEVFLLACRKIDIVEGHANQAAWLYNALNKLILREQQRAYHSREFPLDTIAELGHTDGEPLEHLLPSALSGKERELLCLRLELGLSHQEIARQIGMTEEACRQRFSRLYKKCRMLLSQSPDSER